MSTPQRDRIPICLVTGFLGSGKTTFLKHVVGRHRDRRLVYLVNEFSPNDIDGAIVSETNPDVVSIPGGSIFCKCLVTEFIGQLTRLPERFDGVDGVVIEASGMANPKVIADMLRETRLDERYELARIVSVIDPGSFGKLRFTLPNITAQIEAADIALVNKSDCYSPDVLAETVAALQGIHADLHILECQYGAADFDLFAACAADRGLHGEYAKCKDPNYETITVERASDLDLCELEQRLNVAQEHVYRLKGYASSASQTYYIDYSKSGLTTTPVAPPHRHALVVIACGDRPPAVREFLEWLERP